MSIPIVKIISNGGPVSVEMVCGEGKPGGYVLRVWDAELAGKIFEEPGLFADNKPDVHTIGRNPDKLDDCMVQSITNVILEKKHKKYYVAMIIRQDGVPVPGGKLEEAGTGKGVRARVHLRAMLEVK